MTNEPLGTIKEFFDTTPPHGWRFLGEHELPPPIREEYSCFAPRLVCTAPSTPVRYIKKVAQ